jgi:uncharacterized membrane protein
MHFGWSGGTPPAIGEASPKLDPSKLKVDEITCFLIGAKSGVSTLYLQREINTYKPEPLTSIIPAYTLQELWSLFDADTTLSLVSGAVLVVSLLAMLIALYTALNERRREIAILHAVGLHAPQIFLLFFLDLRSPQPAQLSASPRFTCFSSHCGVPSRAALACRSRWSASPRGWTSTRLLPSSSVPYLAPSPRFALIATPFIDGLNTP